MSLIVYCVNVFGSLRGSHFTLVKSETKISSVDGHK